MKIRFENNSVRFRIRKSELQHLQLNKFIIEKIVFPSSSFQFELHIQDVPEITPSVSENKICIFIPLITADHWIETDEVGIYKLINIGEGKVLDISIEKDFPCKDRTNEDKSDTFTDLAQKNEKGKVC